MPFAYRINSTASQDRLERLIQRRLQPDVNKEEIDRNIWELFGEEWAVMYTDLVGFSRNVSEYGIIHFLQTIYESHRLLVPIIEEFGGILLKVEGDSLMVIFRTVNQAINCAVAMQQCCESYDQLKPDTERIMLCVGLGYGRLLRIGDSDVFGAEVNAACKLGEEAAKAWEILVTGTVRDKAGAMTGVTFEAIDYIPEGADKAYRVRYQL
jgi:class 3 adenylate cyclase